MKMNRFLLIASLAIGGTAYAQEAPADEHPGGESAAAAAAEPANAGEHEAGEPHKLNNPDEFNFTNLDYKGKDVEGGPLGDGKIGERPLAPGEEEESMPAPFLYLVGNFILLLAILAWKAKPAARKAAEARHDEIQKALTEAANLRSQAKAKLDEYESKLAAAEKEISSMVEGMRADAEADKKRIIAAAEAQAAALKKDADERINAEILRARTLLTREVANAASAAAEQLIRDKATAQDQTKLVDTFIGDVAKAQPIAKERV